MGTAGERHARRLLAPITALEKIRARQRTQRLAGEPFGSPADAVRFLGAVQAQEYADSKWALGQRLGGLGEAVVERALDHGELLRTHVLRPTWHYVAAEDVVWMQRLTRPRVHAFNRTIYERLGLDQRTLRRGHDAIGAALADGQPRTRKELAAALAAAGVEAAGGRLAHVVMYAELEALICSGPRRGKQHTYMLIADRARGARELEPEAALTELTRRYFTSHGPATVRDFQWWSGMKVSAVREGLAAVADELVEEVDRDGRSWFRSAIGSAPSSAGQRRARLLSIYDETLVAYQDLRNVGRTEPRPELADYEQPVTIGGRIVGGWRRRIGPRSVAVEIRPITAFSDADRAALRAEVARLGSFFGLPATLTVA